MDENEKAVCSHEPDSDQNQHNEERSVVIIPKKSTSVIESSKPFTISSPSSNAVNRPIRTSVPLIIRPSFQNPIVCQPLSNLVSPKSSTISNQPVSLFLQALSKLNENSLSVAALRHLKATQKENGLASGEITPPDSLASAPPSYSFVLRQMAARRRPRLMGTFIPSPSFVQHTPPPTYGTAFDIYVDNPIPRPTPRVYEFGFASMPAVCPECGFTGMTLTKSKITLCTHMSAFILCLFCCWICAPLPYILQSCKDVYHYCRNCRTFLGMYCPSNPENNFSTT